MPHISHAERREQLVEAATQVIREHGVSAATTRRIVEAADAPLASLHYCFRGKDELYEAVIESVGRAGMRRVASSTTPGMGVAEAAAAILHAIAEWASETYENQLTEYEVYIWAFRAKKYAALPPKHYQEWLDHYVDALKSARRADEPNYDFEALAKMVLAFADGYIVQDQFFREDLIGVNVELAIQVLDLAIENGTFTPRRKRARRAPARVSAS
jgi:TetR/AcrR family transcriptional regulator, regulator of biofilm formation and stress response